ncbi:MAG: (4Fe-4S)-binding protein, partial [Planctomycetia bacterium]|nr:(4Fe-4S)-binding protein [Planctomycetia bacterium]
GDPPSLDAGGRERLAAARAKLADLERQLKALRPPLMRDWLSSRDLPSAPARSFRDQWSRR